MVSSRPRVMMNYAMSLDGKIAPAPSRRRGFFAMSPYPEDHLRMRGLRDAVDAIVIGAGNLRVDDPDLALLPEARAARKAQGRQDPLRVVLTRGGTGLSPRQKVFDPRLGGETIVVHPRSMPESAKQGLTAAATWVALGDTSVEVSDLLQWLASQRAVTTVLSEGGGALNAEFFAARAVDQVYLTLCPRVLGGDGAPTAVDGAGLPVDLVRQATLGSVEQVGDELFLRYDLVWP